MHLIQRKSGRVVTFHDLVKFVESEADLVTDPVFSPDALKAEWRTVPDKPKSGLNRRHPPGSNSFAITADQPQDKNSHNTYNTDKVLDKLNAFFGSRDISPEKGYDQSVGGCKRTPCAQSTTGHYCSPQWNCL